MMFRMAAIAFTGAAMLAYGTPVNLVSNGGFETGDFTSWSLAAAPGAGCSDFGVSNNPIEAHSGTNAAFFQGTCIGSYDAFSQDLATTVGQSYTFDFFIETRAKPTAAQRDLQVFWNNGMILDLPGAGTETYTEYTFDEIATGPSTTIQFQGYNQPNTDFVDDISVVQAAGSVAAPEPSTALLLFAGLGLVVVGYLLRLKI